MKLEAYPNTSGHLARLPAGESLPDGRHTVNIECPLESDGPRATALRRLLSAAGLRYRPGKIIPCPVNVSSGLVFCDSTRPATP